MQRKNHRHKQLYEIIADTVEVPSDAISSIPVFTVRGYHEVEADGCDGILEYSDERVVLAVGKRRVTITGDLLTLSDFRGSILTVRGNIDAVYLTEDAICSEE